MHHYLSNKKPGHMEHIVVDVSFIFNFLYTINGKAIEHLVIKNYDSSVNAHHNTMLEASKEIFKKMGYVDNDDTDYIASMTAVTKGNSYTSTLIKIIDALDAIIVRESDCEIVRAVFDTFVSVTKTEMVVKFKVFY